MSRKKWIVIVCIALVHGIGFSLWYALTHRNENTVAHAARYYCPMHPTYTSDRPGDCPICNMKLVPMEEPKSEDAQSRPPQTSANKICLLHNCTMTNCRMELEIQPGQDVTCPVCGTYVMDTDGSLRGAIVFYRHPMRPEVTSTIPQKDEMGMDYVPVYAEETASQIPVSDRAELTLPSQRRQLIGMKSDIVSKRNLARNVRASGRVAYDPELYNAIAEYREAVQARSKVQESPWPDVRERSDALVRASLLRLRQLGLSSSQIDDFTKGKDQSTNLLLGQEGGTVWVYAQVYEHEIGMIKQGQKVEITAAAYPGRKFYGTIRALDPILSVESRTMKIRVEVPNPEGLLRLEMYVNAAIDVDLGEKLAVPEEAVLDVGRRQIVFIDLGEGRIEPREAQLGQEADGYYEVLSGVREGERVITSANFLIDSESRLKAAIGKTSSPASAQPRKAEPQTGAAIGKTSSPASARATPTSPEHKH